MEEFKDNKKLFLLTKDELKQYEKELTNEYEKIKKKSFSLNMSLGKPSRKQLDISNKLLDVLNSESNFYSQDGMDCRNYGCIDGIPEAREFMANLVGGNPNNTIVLGNSSLNIMFDLISKSFTHGVNGNIPWMKQKKVKFLCPSPGYERHFKITEFFNIEMIKVPMKQDGPDMDLVEKLVSNDESVKGIWCVPKYSNPQGFIYSDEVIRKFAKLKPLAKDFRIYWDNAYCFHYVYPDKDRDILNIYTECKKNKNEDILYEFISTSKMAFPGAGISALITSKNNKEFILKQIKYQSIGPDKLNQMRQVLFFKDVNGVKEHMLKQADIVRPKFELVLNRLDKELGKLNIATWEKPIGGYFITFYSMDGCAKEIVSMAKKLGLIMTPAGAMFPYGEDPLNRVIRIAPTYPDMKELDMALDIFILCVKLVSIRKICK